MNDTHRLRHQPMIRITLPYIYNLSETFEPLSDLKHDSPIRLNLLTFWKAQNALEGLLQTSYFSATLRSARPFAESLLGLLKVQSSNTDLDRVPYPGETFQIIDAFSQFKIAFLAELGTFPSYFVSQKGSFDTITLLDQPSKLFPIELSKKAPEAMFDVSEAGKALCYELPTACGFHIFRGVETVIRRYYTEVTGDKPQPTSRNIGAYVRAMRQCGDEKILSAISQMSTLHRNPIIHPEVVLTMDEAISIIGMAHSVITAMLAALPAAAPTTATALSTVS